jgi:hypothetical protein
MSDQPIKSLVQCCPERTIDLQYLDCRGKGVPGATYHLESTDPNIPYTKTGTLDGNGCAHIDGVPELKGFIYYFEKDPNVYVQISEPSQSPNVTAAKSELDGIGDWIWGTVQGDFNKEQTTGQLVVNTILGFIPIVDQVLDIRDIIAGLKDIIEYYMEPETDQGKHEDVLGIDYEFWLWINVFIIAIGCIPIVGSAVKGVLKGVIHYLKTAGKTATKLSPRQLREAWEYLVSILNRFGAGNAHQWLKNDFPAKIDGWMNEAAGFIRQAINTIQTTIDAAVSGAKFFGFKRADEIAQRAKKYKAALDKAISKLDDMKSRAAKWFKEQVDAITGGAHKSENLGATGTKTIPIVNKRSQNQAEPPDFERAIKWKNADGSINWPPNRGFDGNPTPVTLQPGTRIDRFGYDGGTFVSPHGTPYGKRSLPPGTNQKPYSVYEVIKPIDGMGGKIAPWFDEPGGGIQYELGKSIKELLDGGYIKKVN